MSYTPPTGNLVNFQELGVAYAPPAGNAVNFDGSFSGQASAFLSFTASATGVRGQEAIASSQLVFGADGQGICAPYGRTEYLDLTFVGNASGMVETIGQASAAIPFTSSCTGFAAYGATANAQLAIVGSGVGGSGWMLATGSGTFSLLASGSGFHTQGGVGAGLLAITASASGYRAPVGTAAATLRPIATATGCVPERQRPLSDFPEAPTESTFFRACRMGSFKCLGRL